MQNRKGYLLGVDIGTYESKGVLVTTTGGVIAHCTRAHKLEIPQPGWAEHDADRDWWGDLCFITRELLKTSGIDRNSILAAGCSTIGPCTLPVGNDGRPLRPAILYGIDTRASSEIESLNQSIGHPEVLRRCGNALSAQSVGPKILWLKNHEPEVYSKAAAFVSGTSYLVWKLTGSWVIDHYSASTFTPLYDICNRKWSSDLGGGIVERERLADIAWTTELAGRVTSEAEVETGLPAGLPVIVGTTDAASEAVSAGVVQPGRMMLMYGTTTFMILPRDELVCDRRIWSAPFLFPGTYAVMAGMSTTGALTRWFRDHFARDLIRVEDEQAGNAYQALAGEAGEIPPCAEGLVVLPYFSGERTPLNDPQARGVIFGLTLSHTRAHLYRAVLEAVGFGVRHHLEVFDALGAWVQDIHAVGGGVKNPLWLQIVSDICQVTQLVPGVSLGAAYGDAFLAGMGAGVFASPLGVLNWVEMEDTVAPDPALASIYDRQYRLYRELYEATRDLMRRDKV